MQEPAELEKSDEAAYELDPTFLHARREAWIILAVFAAFAIYSLTVSYIMGYRSPVATTGEVEPASVPLLLGMPRWVVFGVLMPWLVATAVTGWFCFFVMRNDSLEDTIQPEGNVTEGGSSRDQGGENA